MELAQVGRSPQVTRSATSWVSTLNYLLYGQEVKLVWPCVPVGGVGASCGRERRKHRALNILARGRSPLVGLGDWCCWWGTSTCACTSAGGVRRPQHVPTLCFYQVFGAFSWSGIFPIHSAPLASAGVCARFARSSHMVAVGRQSSVAMGPWSIVATTCELE